MASGAVCQVRLEAASLTFAGVRGLEGSVASEKLREKGGHS